jgi:hypothetical protein
MRVALCLCLLTASARAAPAAHLWLDARLPYDKPIVRVAIDGHVQALALDSGAKHHCWSLAKARAAGVEMTYMPPLADVYGRRHPLFLVAATALQAEGLGELHQPLYASDSTDGIDPLAPRLPHVDGVLRPQELPSGDGALLVDFVHGALELTSWPAALARTAGMPRRLADGPALQDGSFVVDASINGRSRRLEVDTGAAETLLFDARREDLPAGAVRASHDLARVHVGEIDRELLVERLEPLATPPHIDGILGMDLLRNCVLALDSRRLVARCRDAPEALAVGSFAARPPSQMQLEEGGGAQIALERRGDGYYYCGSYIEADIAPDGTVEVRPLDDSLGVPIDEEERQWLLDATRSLRIALAEAWSLRSSSARLLPHLAGVWRDRHWSARERREILFRIWDEAAEPDDPELGLAGADARRIIAGFVRRELPRDSFQGYSDAELAYYNAQRPRGPRFDPYALFPADRDAAPSR